MMHDGVPGSDVRLLFAHLVINRSRSVPLAELAALLDHRRDSAETEARVTASLDALAGTLGGHLERPARPEVRLRLPTDSWVDVEVAEQAALAADAALGAGDPQRAVEQARTAARLLEEPYLQGLGGVTVEARRQQLGDLLSGVLHRLAGAALALEPPAIPTARKAATELVERQPYRESGYALLMEAHARAGDPAAALEVFERLRSRLCDELGAEPGPAVVRLHDRLARMANGDAGTWSGSAGTAAPAPSRVGLPGTLARLDRRSFVGRTAPLARLRDRWERACRGDGGLVVVGGEAGVGKSRLAGRLAGEARAGGATVLYGRADEDGVTPYQPFVEALRHYARYSPDLASTPQIAAAARELAGLVPALGGPPGTRVDRPPGERQRYRLFDAVVAILSHAAGERPLLLVIDDLQWADTPTVLLLRDVARQAPGSALLVVATYREQELEPSDTLARLLGELRREDVMHRISLPGLENPEIAKLLEEHGASRGDDPELARRLREQTGGNPFFIEELLRARAEAPDAPVSVPDGVKDVLGRRLERLPEDATDVLMTAAVLGREFRLDTLHEIAGDLDVEAAIEAAVGAGLVVEDPDDVGRLAFAHALVRETLYERPGHNRRLRIHRVVAESLEEAELDVHPAELAHHYFLAREVGGAPKALAYSLRAAEVAGEAHAPEDAAAHYTRALTALALARPDDREARADVLLALGAARWQASQPGPRMAFEEAAVLARELGSAERLARAALGAGGRFYAPGVPDRPYVALLEEALATIEPADSLLRSRLLSRLAEQLVSLEPSGRPAEVAREALAMARRIGEPGALASALMSRHAALLAVEHAEERRRLAEEALALAGELDDEELAALGRHWLIYDLVELGELPEARRRHAELETLAGRLRQPLYRHSALAWRCVWAGLAGRFEAAERLARESVRLAESAGDPDAREHYTSQLLTLRRAQGRTPELIEDMEGFATAGGVVGRSWLAALAPAYVEAGEPDRAAVAYREALEDGPAAMPRTMAWLPTVASLAEASASLRDAAGAEALYAALEPYADRLIQSGFAGCGGSVHRLLGRLAATLGRREAAAEHFEAALERHVALEAPALIERTERDAAELPEPQATE